MVKGRAMNVIAWNQRSMAASERIQLSVKIHDHELSLTVGDNMPAVNLKGLIARVVMGYWNEE